MAEPDTRWSYSSGTTNILCDVAQDASGLGVGMAYELVFGPLGMDSAVIEPAGWVPASTRPVRLETAQPYGAHWWVNQGADGALRMPSVPADAFWASATRASRRS